MSEMGGRRPDSATTPLGGGASDLWGWDRQRDRRRVRDHGQDQRRRAVPHHRPDDPVFLGQIPNTRPAQLQWHDIKVYKDHAFIVSESVAHGMNVFDLTRLRGVTEPQTWHADTNYPTAFSAHNIAINEETGFAYLVGGNNGLSLPTSACPACTWSTSRTPKLPGLRRLPRHGEGRGTAAASSAPRQPVSYIHDTQCVVYRGPDEDYAGASCASTAARTTCRSST
jgi:hypothetical protein